ncbi:hypothetical protein PPTG_16261 [Phytophthora nicotianae INRA-310]|uniref:Uncharacterized protein n=1 Tax=Phytophthora nicotianae (strain INRA-310) TaxID=761204 RepID=W2PRL9_PHYN3|nr:hypothetical protein PPTG_16261 [Phytophthora nicotianae INRA-310]ETN02660.1 hypothetical protein PPTG_16261 [Phytophthora nicotianae INRA-310]
MANILIAWEKRHLRSMESGDIIPTNIERWAKLPKALNTGKLSLTANQLKGSGSVIHLHPASYEKALKARN